MTDRPILFSAPMVRALLVGRKTQTRRLVGPQPDGQIVRYGWSREGGATWTDTTGYVGRIPIWTGDRLWVREAWRVSNRWDETKPSDLRPRSMTVFFEAGGSIANQEAMRGWEPSAWPGLEHRPDWVGKLRPSMFIPRWASRITLAVTDVKIERLKDLTQEDAIAEGLLPETCAGQRMWDPGIGGGHFGDPRVAYHMLWDHINGPGAWDANPWVAAYTFDVHHTNIEAMP